VLRSLHPVHSVCAYGKNAAFITEGHEHCKTGCGEGTPYLKIRDLGGKALLLGVDMDRNTVMHSLEEAIDAKYLRTLEIVAPTYLENYQDRTFTLEKFPPGHRDFMMITPYLRRAGAITEGKIGKAVTKCIDMQKLFQVVMPMLEQDPLLFICHNDHCNSCHWSRLLYTDQEINMDKYKENCCTDETCEICVI
jgi:aminoglycoside 3-N-acetyltransferase